MKRSVLTLPLLILPLAAGLLVGNASTSAQATDSPQELNLASKIGSTCNLRSKNGDKGESSFGVLSAVTDKWLVLDSLPPDKNSKPQTRHQTWIPRELMTSIDFVETK